MGDIAPKPIHMVGCHLKTPKGIVDKHRDVCLTADSFFVNEMPFFLSLSRKTNCTGVQNLDNRKASSVFDAFCAIHRFHRR